MGLHWPSRQSWWRLPSRQAPSSSSSLRSSAPTAPSVSFQTRPHACHLCIMQSCQCVHPPLYHACSFAGRPCSLPVVWGQCMQNNSSPVMTFHGAMQVRTACRSCLAPRQKTRKAIEAAGLPHTYVVSYGFASYWANGLGELSQKRDRSPPSAHRRQQGPLLRHRPHQM